MSGRYLRNWTQHKGNPLVNGMSVSSFKILCGVGLLAIFSSTIFKIPALPLLVSLLGGGPSAIGLIASNSACAGILFSFPAGILSDRIGRKRMLVFSSIVFATAPFLYLLVREIWQLALVRFYHGLATAIFVPVAMCMVADLYQQGRGEKMGWFSTATLLSRFVAPAVGGALLGITGHGQDTGFHLVYMTCGGLALLSCRRSSCCLMPGWVTRKAPFPLLRASPTPGGTTWGTAPPPGDHDHLRHGGGRPLCLRHL